jgi:hypothetical protein
LSDSRQFISPQPGFQEAFLSSPADIVIGGGAAGAGKSYALLMEPLRFSHVPGFYSVIFRRTTVQIKNSGGLWDTSKEIYLKLRDAAGRQPVATEAPPKWKFPSGSTLLFSHLEHEQNKFDWDGAQIALLGFDELIHFSSSQFWYLVGRNRSSSGVRPYVRATTNPQTSGWVKRLISWWIYPDDYEVFSLRGMPIRERAGVIRYLARWNENNYWGDTAEQAIASLPPDARERFRPELVKSVTFIPGSLSENVLLTEKDPAYEGNLLAQDKKHGSRLLNGCWYDAEGENELYRYEDLYDMFSNTFAPDGDMYMTADIAMEGSDIFRVGIWSGLRLMAVYSWEKSDGKMIWEQIQRLAREWKVPGRNIVFDTNGVGNFLAGFFRSSFDFRSQSSPLDEPPGNGDAGRPVKVNYQNLRVQCAFCAARLIEKHGIYVAVENSTEQDAIIEEFEAHKKTGENSSGKLTITPKEEVKAAIRRSPDYFDMIIMRMVFELSRRRLSYLAQPPQPAVAAGEAA